MTTFLIAFEPVIVVFHFIVAFVLIGVILLQAGKGTDIGAVFGAGARSVFGSTSQGSWLTKLTTTAAMIFLLTSLSLATISKFSVSTSQSVMDDVATDTEQSLVPDEDSDDGVGIKTEDE